jgi:plasmid stabilization system protein ParE
MPNEDDADLPIYEVRMTEPAEAEVEKAYLWYLQSGQEMADRWYEGFLQAIRSLEQLPQRFPVVPEAAASRDDIRQMVFGKKSAAYRVLYRIIEAADDSPGIVRILHVRHASRQRGIAPSAETNPDD